MRAARVTIAEGARGGGRGEGFLGGRDPIKTCLSAWAAHHRRVGPTISTAFITTLRQVVDRVCDVVTGAAGVAFFANRAAPLGFALSCRPGAR